MKKTKKVLLILLFIAIFILLGAKQSNASGDLYLQNLDFQAQINQDGSMDVTETWNIEIEDTNTLFKTFKTDKTKYTTISNVQVTDITNGQKQNFTEINQLMYHVTKNCYYGLKNDDGNFEIAWGVGLDNSSGTRRYQISYTVEDAISKYEDCAELYWQFVGSDFEISSKKVTGTILLPESASKQDEIKVWGHTEDLNGEIYCTDRNKIEFEINQFRAGRYIEIRTLFPTAMITSSGRVYTQKRLDHVIAEETKWAEEANQKRERIQKNRKLISILVAAICLIVDIHLIRESIKTIQKASQKEKIKPTLELEYFREMPRKNATPAQALYLYRSQTTDFNAKEMGRIFSATILNLSLKKYIEFENKTEKKNDIIIKIIKREADETLERSEKEVLQYIVGASRNDNQVTIKELERYMKRYTTNLISTKDDIEKSTRKELEKNQLYNPKEAEEQKQYSTQATSIRSFHFYSFIYWIGINAITNRICIWQSNFLRICQFNFSYDFQKYFFK